MAETKPEISWLQPESFRLLVDSVSDYAIFMLDQTGTIRTWNAGAARIKGYSAAEIVGKHFSIFYPAADVQSGKCEYELKMAAEVGRFEDENWRLRKDGTRFWANVIITALRDAEGELRGFAKVTRDLTERRAAEEQLRQSELRLRLLVENIQDYAVFMLDPNGQVSTWNAGAENILQYRSDEIVGRHFSLFYPPEEIENGHPQRELEVAAATGRYEEEDWRVRKDGTRFCANVVLSSIRDQDQRLVGFAKVTRDLTSKKAAERDQMARLAAEQANRSKDEFLAMLGHELRNPLAPTLMALQLLKLRGDSRTAREQQIIERQVKYMARLVDDLLDISRITRGAIELQKERVDVRTAIARAIEMASPLIEERRHDLEVNVPAEELLMQADSLRLAQIFTNLLTNAAKYTPNRGHLVLTARREGDEVAVEVRDDGIGIDGELLPRVFDTFVQAPQSPARTSGGLGIGLALVRAFVNLHGGTATAASPGLGKGSTFTVRLPLSPTTATAAHADPAATGVPLAKVPLRVLVVDDNEDGLAVTSELLRLCGHEVRTATSGPAALQQITEDFPPDVAILDLGLPGMDGYELAHQIRATLAPRTPRLIALTGYGQPSDRDRSHQAGFDLHLVKPVDVESLLSSITPN